MKTLRLWAVCLALVSFASCSAFAQTPPNAPAPAAPTLTGPVAHISIAGLKNISLDTVQAQMTVKPGDAYTPEAAQKDVDALKNMGVFQAKISVSATQTKTVSAAHTSLSGVTLIYTVAENPVVQSIKFTANTPSVQPSVPAADLIAQMKTRVGQTLNTNVLSKDLDGIFDQTSGYAIRHGRHMAVSSDINIDPKTGVLAIPLVEYYISSIKVSGNSRIKTADILAKVHTKVGDLYDGNILKSDASSIYEMGSVRNLSYTTDATQPGQIKITFSVVEQAPATGILDGKQGKVIPFLYDPITIPTPVIQVSINGKPPLPFVVDTGSTAGLLLNFWAAQKLGLHLSNADEKASNYVYKRTSVQDVVLMGQGSGASADFGTQAAQVSDLSILDQIFANVHIAGAVGLGLLQPITSRFDFAAKTLTIFTTPHPPLYVPGGTVLPLRSNSMGVFTIHAVLAPSTAAELIVDTGSSSTQVPLSSLKALRPTATAFASGARVDLEFVCPDLRLAGLDLGSLHVPDVVVSILPPQIDLSLGMDILAGYRLTLDGPNGQLILEPSTHSGRYASGHSGLEVKRSGVIWIVSALTPKMPAQKAGIRVGDEVLTIGGASVGKLTMLQISRRLSGIVEVPVQTSVRRGAKRLTISWVPGDEFSSPRSAIDGISMTKSPGGPWVVADVMKGYPGDLAGLQAGDEITHIDGQAVAGIPMSSYGGEEAEEQLMVSLEVERPGVAQPFTVRLTVPKQPQSALTKN